MKIKNNFENKPLLSVIMSAYNAEKYIEKCINSILNQSFNDFELIIVEHDSNDNTRSIVKKLAIENPKINLILCENLSLSESRNCGLQNARGAYITFIDADDYIDSDMYKVLMETIIRDNSDIVICDYYMEYVNQTKSGIIGFKNNCIIDVSKHGIDKFYVKYFGNNPNIWNKIYKKEIIFNNNIKFEVNNGEDLLFNLRILPYINTVSIVAESFYHYVQRASSLWHEDLNKYSSDSVNIIETYFKGEINQTENKLAYYSFANMFTGFLFSTYCNKQKTKFFLKQIKILRKSTLFNSFCFKLSKSKELNYLYTSGAVSKKYYATLKSIFYWCNYKLDIIAALEMKLITIYIYNKYRKLNTIFE